MRFVSMLSDGDSKTFQFLSDNKIYGSDIKIEKEECLNHIAKRLGTSLRNKVKEWKVKKVTLGGRKQGSLTDKNITELQNYYRKAIKDNVPDTDKMKTAIYASLMHCSSTDKKPMHGKCPEGESSWCFYKRAIAKGETPGSHSSMRTYLSPQVVEKIMPVYQRLASDTILERCVAGKTQNSNESLHSCIWRKCPKEVFVSKRRLEIAVTDAIEKHNLGYVKSLEAKEDSCLNDSFSLTIAERQGESTVRAIKKNEAAIIKSVISGTRLSIKFASYRRDVLLERTERAIAIWIEEQVQRKIPVNGYLIQEKALQFYKSMKQSEPSTSTSLAGKEFSVSKGWLTRFLKRNALHNIQITGESATADEGAPKIFPEELGTVRALDG
ncbi:uncharacterized protein TNCV_2631791 [Trichonephila clavipes]|nr:uncharacterized protein TNCV_2631791 [Trichonephila clavipes]